MKFEKVSTHSINAERSLKVFALSLSVIFLCFYLLTSCTFQRSSEDYYADMLLQYEKTDKFTFSDVFEFDFDKAYIIHTTDEVYGDKEYFLEALNVTSTLELQELPNGGMGRVLFVKDNCIIYDFIYDVGCLNIENVGCWILPDTNFVASKKDDILYLSINVE